MDEQQTQEVSDAISSLERINDIGQSMELLVFEY